MSTSTTKTKTKTMAEKYWWRCPECGDSMAINVEQAHGRAPMDHERCLWVRSGTVRPLLSYAEHLPQGGQLFRFREGACDFICDVCQKEIGDHTYEPLCLKDWYETTAEGKEAWAAVLQARAEAEEKRAEAEAKREAEEEERAKVLEALKRKRK